MLNFHFSPTAYYICFVEMRKGRLSSASASASSSKRQRRRTIENVVLRILILAVLASIVISHKKHSKIQLMDVEEDYEMMRTRSTDDDNAILEDLEIGEYQDMEMNEMYGINESSREMRRQRRQEGECG